MTPLATYLACLAGLFLVNVPSILYFTKGKPKMITPEMQAQIDALSGVAGGLEQAVQAKIDAAVALAKADWQRDHDTLVSTLSGQVAQMKQVLGL